jgi:hypothetical protein
VKLENVVGSEVDPAVAWKLGQTGTTLKTLDTFIGMMTRVARFLLINVPKRGKTPNYH